MEKTKCRITLILDLEGHNDLLKIKNVKTERTILYFVILNVNEQLKWTDMKYLVMHFILILRDSSYIMRYTEGEGISKK